MQRGGGRAADGMGCYEMGWDVVFTALSEPVPTSGGLRAAVIMLATFKEAIHFSIVHIELLKLSSASRACHGLGCRELKGRQVDAGREGHQLNLQPYLFFACPRLLLVPILLPPPSFITAARRRRQRMIQGVQEWNRYGDGWSSSSRRSSCSCFDRR